MEHNLYHWLRKVVKQKKDEEKAGRAAKRGSLSVIITLADNCGAVSLCAVVLRGDKLAEDIESYRETITDAVVAMEYGQLISNYKDKIKTEIAWHK